MRPPLTPPQLVTCTMSDGYVVRGRWWPGSASPASTAVVYLHGIQSHGGWYEWSGARLAALGLPVFMPDRRGSGMNDAERGDVPAAARWLADVDEAVAWVRASSCAARIAIVGVSWGGKLALAWSRLRPEARTTLLLVTPGVFPQVGVGFAEKVRIGAGLLTGGTGRHAIPLDDPSLFTQNPAGQKFIAADERKLMSATARFLFNSARLDRTLARSPARSLHGYATLLLASDDRIIRNQLTERWLRRVAAEPPRVSVLPGAHTLEFEVDPEPFERALVDWATHAAAEPHVS